ncbi:hypothetical protein [Pedobacter psychroterrae]|uniref:Uncharacterized protein n=1 Tax=Pedobacter psychroterrae TaxID=2530453 RepID=A0A4R0NCJ1_9SPHI|nr:hypothetical protein [Pedobacter psychroterrae]TCC98051.1 hypothetical protein EZ437_19600 [Pedobacter psychroterrae]
MNRIKGLRKLSVLKADPISGESLDRLENEALYYKEYWNLEFEIRGVQEPFILIIAIQGEVLNQNYADQDTIIMETKRMFGKFIVKANIHVRAIINIPSPPSIVNSEWLTESMLDAGILMSELQAATGIDKKTLQDWISDRIPMNRPVKAMFYYYLLYREKLRD